MNRRQFLAYSAGTLVIGATATAVATAADDQSHVEYSRDAYEQALASGEPFMLDFYASWWGTCRSQERTVRALQEGNADYAAVKIMKVDWTVFGKKPIVTELNIPRRSTLVMFNDGKEVARVVAQTSKDAIEDLFKAALAWQRSTLIGSGSIWSATATSLVPVKYLAAYA